MWLTSADACVHGADWVEHAIETGGEPYLHTPEAELSIFVRHSLDTYGFCLAVLCVGVCLVAKLLGRAVAATRDFVLNGKVKGA
jgi:hypothetical protein